MQEYESLGIDTDTGFYSDAQCSFVIPYNALNYAIHYNVSLLPDQGGCFRRGPGAICHKDMTLYNEGELSFSGMNMYISDTYLFRLILHEDGDWAVGYLFVEIEDGNPPDLTLKWVYLVFRFL